MAQYAEHTSVSVERSRAEIDRLLTRYGAEESAMAQRPDRAAVQFKMHDRYVRFTLPLPNRDDAAFTHREDQWGRVKAVTPEKALAAWEQACRQRWRALALVIKAKLEAVETGITTFEDEFMAHIVLPDGMTVGERVRPGIAAAYAGAPLPSLLPDYSAGTTR